MSEAEIAEHLRCSISKVRKLRYAGKLDFIPGRPVLVTNRALAEYLEIEECRRVRTRPLRNKRQAEAEAAAAQVGKLSGAALTRMLWLRRRAAKARG